MPAAGGCEALPAFTTPEGGPEDSRRPAPRHSVSAVLAKVPGGLNVTCVSYEQGRLDIVAELSP